MTQSVVLDEVVDGLKVIAAQLPYARSCVGVLSVPTGYADDPPGREGTAHLTEHICVVTAPHRDRVQMGARTEATATRYSARTTPSSAATLLAALTSPFDPKICPAALHESETRAVLTENARVRDQPQLQVASAVAALAAPTLDVAFRDTTTEHSIAAVTPDDVVAFRQRRYRPTGSVLCLVGPGDPDELLAQAHAAAAILPGGREPVHPGPARGPAEPCQSEGWKDCFLWSTLTPPADGDDDQFARRLAVELLVGTGGLLDESGTAVGSRSTGYATLPGRHTDLHVVAWPAGAHTATLAAELTERAADRLESTGRAAVAGARARLRSRIAFDQQSPGGLAAMLVRHALGQGPWPAIADIDLVDDRRVIELADRMLHAATVWQIADGRLGTVSASR